MRRSSWFTFAYVAMVGAAGPLAACAGTGSTEASAPPVAASTQAQAQTPATQTGVTYSDMQVQNFVAARNEILALSSAQQQDQAQVGAILQRHALAPDVYNAINTRAQTDENLSNRIAAVGVGTSFSDAQLRSFAAASAEIDPLNRQLATATAEQRTTIADQIRAVLARNNLDLQTYNGIVTRAQTDTALASRIASLAPATPPNG